MPTDNYALSIVRSGIREAHIMNDIVEISKEFFREALLFLKLPEDQWPEIVEETRFDPEHKMTPPYVDYDNRKFVIHVPFVEAFVRQMNQLPKEVGRI